MVRGRKSTKTSAGAAGGKKAGGKTLHFKSGKGYKKWVAYGHIHGVMGNKTSGFPKVKIRGRAHKVKH